MTVLYQYVKMLHKVYLCQCIKMFQKPQKEVNLILKLIIMYMRRKMSAFIFKYIKLVLLYITFICIVLKMFTHTFFFFYFYLN